MRRIALALCTTLLSTPFVASAERLIPAGSLISCTVAEPKINSKTTAIGDPVLCQVSAVERYGRSMLPYNSFLEGRFEDYKDPGHFVGKGWMELKFDRMVIEPDTVIPVDARVVDVPGYRVDQYGRILGKGHAVRDTVTWMIPILWPIDLINLPRRGPRPTLKEETRLTLKILDDLTLPDLNPLQQDPSGLYRRPTAENEPPPEAAPEPAPAPAEMAYDQPAPAPDPEPAPEPAPYAAAPAPPVYAAPAPVPYVAVPPPAYYYGGGVGVGVYGYVGPRPYGYAPRPYGYGPRPYAGRPYGNGFAPRPYGGAPRTYAYGAPRSYGYGARPGGAMASRGYSYGGGARGGVARGR